MYSQKVPYKVYTHDEWWADDWDAKLFGRTFDFSRPFFEQFHELLLAVPRFSIMNVQSQDCEYSNFVIGSKNCYLIFGCVDDEDCAYGHIVWESRDSLDNLYLYKSELCYECIDCLGSYKLFYCQECESCSESIGLYDCNSCTNCIGCVGLRQKSYHIFNEFVGKEGYNKFLIEHPLIAPETIQLILEKQKELRRQLPQRHFFGSHNSNVSGNHIYNAKNIHYSFDIKGGEDAKYVFTGRNIIDAYDGAFNGTSIELAYETLTCQGRGIQFSHLCFSCNDVYYSDTCFNSHDVFGCVGLKNGEYCILNRQYSKEEYEALVPKIIEHMKQGGEWGQFFPIKLSPFCYNESIANEYMPLTKEQALAKGFRWNDEMPSTVGQETISNNTLPKNPDDFSDELTEHILKCDKCGRNYRLILKEIGFYKQMKLSLPRDCFNCRHQRRMNMRNSRRLWLGICAKCNKNIETSYSPEQQKEFRIYCDQCYKSEMV